MQVDRIRRQAPIGSGGHAVAERLHEADVPAPQPELDADAGEGVGPSALPFHAGLAHEHGESGGLVELHRVAACREIAAVDGHLAAPPHAVVALEAYPIGDNDVGLPCPGVRARAVLDGRATRCVHLERVAHALHRAVVRQVGPAQHRSGIAIHRHDVLMGLEPLLPEKIGRRRGVQRDRGVADVHGISLADHVEPADAGEPGHAVRSERAARTVTMSQDAAAGEHVGLSGADLHLLGLPPHRVDDDLARPPGRVGTRRRLLLGESEEEHGGHHWFGRVNLPPSPVTRFAVTILKAGSAVKPCPLMCRVGSSKTNGLSELT